MLTSEKKLVDIMGIPISSHIIEIGKYKIHYISTGKGKPLLLIHGINFGWGQWYKTIPELAKNFSVFAIDLPGSGTSQRLDDYNEPLYSLYPNIIRRFISQLHLINPSIIGHSIGGWIALSLACDEKTPLDKIVVMDSLGFSDYLVWKQRPLVSFILARLLSRTVMAPTYGNMVKFLQSVLYDQKTLSPELVEYYHETINTAPISHPFILINQLIQPFKIKDSFVLNSELNKIIIPTAIFFGEHDPLLPLRKNIGNFSKISNQITHIVPNSGHVPPIENPQFVNTHLTQFLSQ